MSGAISLLPQYAFMAWCLVKHRDNFTFLPLFFLYLCFFISVCFYLFLYFFHSLSSFFRVSFLFFLAVFSRTVVSRFHVSECVHLTWFLFMVSLSLPIAQDRPLNHEFAAGNCPLMFSISRTLLTRAVRLATDSWIKTYYYYIWVR